jgi:hypothetical protein
MAMGIAPQDRTYKTSDRPLTGSMLFPDLVWAHWVWQCKARPRSFERDGRARRLLGSFARLNGRPPQRRLAASNGAGMSPPSDLKSFEDAYEREAEAFQKSEGRIIRAYWCTSEASAVVLTERTRRRRWVPWRSRGNQRLHRVTDWVTTDAPQIAELLHGADALAIRISRVLHPIPRRIALEWVFSEQSYLLGFVERTGGRPRRKETIRVVARHREEIDRIERYYDRAAKKAARIRYFYGMLLGLLPVAALGVLSAGFIELFGDLDLSSAAARNFYACLGAGALGAVVSVMTRMRQEDGLKLDYEVGPALIVMLGAFRPVLGAIFGTVAYFALESGFLPLTPPETDKVFFYYPLIAFFAGFSERFAHVVLGDADLSVARALSGADTVSMEIAPNGSPAAATSANGAVTAVPASHPTGTHTTATSSRPGR